MNKSAPMWLAALAVGVGLVAGGCAERKTTVRRETTETVRQPRVVEEHTVIPAPSEETTVIERHRHSVEDDQ